MNFNVVDGPVVIVAVYVFSVFVEYSHRTEYYELLDVAERELIKFIYIVWILAKNGINLGVLTTTGLLAPLGIFSK